MAGSIETLRQSITKGFMQFSPAQRLTIILAVLLSLAGIVGFIQWASRPDYVPLFSNLPPDEAGKIADWLSDNNMEFKLEQGGSRILVTNDNVYKARISLAQEGLPSPRSTGYEIFDATNLGMSEFVQKINFRRALEGELARTIENMDEVTQARVHIVIPEQALFRNKEKPTTASVVLNVQNKLKEQHITGISYLVSSAVEGLEIENVAILDTRGNLLSSNTDSDPLMSMSNTQMQLKESVENNLTNKVSSMLGDLLGSEKVIVRLSVDLDFSRTEVTEELYDPELTAIRSENTVETSEESQEQRMDSSSDPNTPVTVENTSTGNETNTLTNYEVSKTLNHKISQTGGIQRISASILIDGTYENVVTEDENGDQVTNIEYRPRADDEMNRITTAVRTALGINEQRGDQISVINIPFQAPQPLQEEVTLVNSVKNNWYEISKKVLLFIAVIGVLLYIKKLLKKSGEAAEVVYKRELLTLPKPPKPVEELPMEVESPIALLDFEEDIPDEIREANQLQKQLSQYAEEKPESAAKLLRTWLVEG